MKSVILESSKGRTEISVEKIASVAFEGHVLTIVELNGEKVVITKDSDLQPVENSLYNALKNFTEVKIGKNYYRHNPNLNK